MVDQLPNLGREKEMLNELGLETIDDLFSNIPPNVRSKESLPLPPPQSEEEIWADANRILGANISLDDRPSFLSAGLSRNYVPSVVGMLATRGEFLTSYTPYQPEVSQGMLQAMWEFQTMISELVELPVANVSMYDASTSAAEAITCAVRVHNRKSSQKDTIYVSEFVPPHRLSVIKNYTQGAGIEIKLLKHDDDGMLDIQNAVIAKGSCAVYVEQPNCFGILDSGLAELKSIIGNDTCLVVGVDVVSLGHIQPPGLWGADIVVGEGQSFGIGPTGGGPIYGIFACSQKYLRQMPGRVVGQSWDSDGNLAFTLTLSTREQHIRRHKATSNICSNETLIALMGSIHMSLLGPEGLNKLSMRIAANTRILQNHISSINELKIQFPDSLHFREIAIRLPGNASELLEFLDSRGILGGFDLGRWWKDKENMLLIGVDERTKKSDIELLTNEISEWLVNKDE